MPSRRRRETRRRLVEVAFDVFAEFGIADAPIEVICERAGFTRGAFYSNFTSKEGLFLALYEQELADRLERLREGVQDVLDAPATPPLTEAVTRMVGLFTEHLAADTTWYRLTSEFEAQSLRRPEIREQIVDVRRDFHTGMEEVLRLSLARMGLRLAVPMEDALLSLEAVYEAVLRRSLLLGAPSGASAAVNGLLPRIVSALVEPDRSLDRS